MTRSDSSSHSPSHGSLRCLYSVRQMLAAGGRRLTSQSDTVSCLPDFVWRSKCWAIASYVSSSSLVFTPTRNKGGIRRRHYCWQRDPNIPLSLQFEMVTISSRFPNGCDSAPSPPYIGLSLSLRGLTCQCLSPATNRAMA